MVKSSKKKKAVLNKKNATPLKNSRLKSLKKKFKESNLFGMPLMYIGLNKHVEGLEFDTVYPVFKIETEEVEIPLINLNETTDTSDGKITDAEMTLDKDDEAFMEELLEAKIQEAKRNANQEYSVVVWLLVGNQKTGKILWVDSADAYYLG